MVNFKVSRGANSLSGNAAAPDISDKKYVNKKTQKESQDVVSLKVVALEKLGLTNTTYDCLLPTSAFSVLSAAPNENTTATGKSAFCFFTLEKHSDVVLRGARAVDYDVTLRENEIAIMKDVRINAHVGEDIRYSFLPFASSGIGKKDILHDVTLEVRPLDNDNDGESVTCATVDAKDIEKTAQMRLGGRFVSVGEVFAFEALNLKVRIVETNSLPMEERLDIKYHCFRGIVDVAETTLIYVQTAPRDVEILKVLNARAPPNEEEMFAKDFVHVHTNDEEVFPVHMNVLRPCVALTKFIRSAASESNVSCTVDIDTVLFDRVLIFLTCIRDGEKPPHYDLRVTESLAGAAKTLQCAPLIDYCDARLGSYISRLREYSWKEIVKKNSEEEAVLLVIDNMVLDVKNWLPEHPGGDMIIPAQSLNKDASTHFELYHSSKESFLYLKHFYVGEVCEEDRDKIPRSEAPTSSEFLKMLRDYCEDFRIPIESKAKKKEFF
jgi:cytochrome b involved in lipid metabolism